MRDAAAATQHLRDPAVHVLEWLARGLRAVHPMDAEAVRKALIAQHDQLRVHLNRCSTLARMLRCGEPVQFELDAALARLRLDFAEHNTAETTAVRQLLHDSPGWGALLIDRMLEEHVAEHAAFWELLVGSAAEIAQRMDALVDELDAHMAAEERTFLSPVVLREEVITRRRRPEPA